MVWSHSEFLNLLEVRSQCWCFVGTDSSSGFVIPANDVIFCYAMVEGSASISSATGTRITLHTGDVAMIISGKAHAVRTGPDCHLEPMEFLKADSYVDLPPTFEIGSGARANRLLCGRLKVRWPGGTNARLLPESLTIPAQSSVVNLAALVNSVPGSGGAALLTRAASLLVISALRAHPQCQAIFQDAGLREPISRAIQIMEKHPFRDWTVGALAGKVQMGRSNFATRFLAETSKSPMEALTDIRMQLAAKLLIQSHLKIADIGERVGYHSESAFTRRFAAYFQMTPSKMRRRQVVEERQSAPLAEAVERLRTLSIREIG